MAITVDGFSIERSEFPFGFDTLPLMLIVVQFVGGTHEETEEKSQGGAHREKHIASLASWRAFLEVQLALGTSFSLMCPFSRRPSFRSWD